MDTTLIGPATTLSRVMTMWSGMSHTAPAAPACRERTLVIAGPIGDSRMLVAPLMVVMRRDDQGWFTVSDDVFLQWGEGRTEAEALEDYMDTLSEYYGLVLEGAESSEGDRLELRRLNRYVSSEGQPVDATSIK